MKKNKNNEQRKLKLYRLASIISYILSFLLTIVIGIISPVNDWIGLTLLSVTISLFVLTIIFYILLDKQKKKIMNNSVEYYKQRMPFFGIQILIIFICLFFSAVINAENQNINFEILLNFNISLTSIIFVVLTFIVPHMKERISQLMKNIKRKKVEIKGRVYNTIQKYNQSYTVALISIVLFFICVGSTILNDTHIQMYYLLISVFYNSYVLIKLFVSIKSIFWINIKDVKDMLEDNNKK